MTETEAKNPKKRKLPQPEEIKQESQQSDEPFSFYSLMNIPKTASTEEIVDFSIFFSFILYK